MVNPWHFVYSFVLNTVELVVLFFYPFLFVLRIHQCDLISLKCCSSIDFLIDFRNCACSDNDTAVEYNPISNK